MRSIPILSFLLVSVACLFLFACGNKEAEETTQSEKTANEPPPQVVTYITKQESVPIYGEWVGQTDASQTVNIRARVDGTLEKTSFAEGDYVNKDQVLFKIEDASYKAAVQSAKAELEKARAQLRQAQQQVQLKEQGATQAKYESALQRANQDLKRVKALTEQGALSQHDLDVAVDAQKQAKAQVDAQKAIVKDTGLNQTSSIETAKANVDSAEAALTQANLNLGYTTIKSPLHGIIGRIQVYPGNLVSKQDDTTLATISSVDPIKVVFSVSEAEYLKVAKRYANTGKTEDNPLELLLADNTVYPQKGRFQLVDRAVDSKTGTIDVQALFPNPQAILRPGQFARVKTLIENKKDAILIPDKCVQDMQGNKTVYVVSPEKKVELRNVSLGSKLKDQFVVLSGLAAGEQVISEGLQKVKPGMKVALAQNNAP